MALNAKQRARLKKLVALLKRQRSRFCKWLLKRVTRLLQLREPEAIACVKRSIAGECYGMALWILDPQSCTPAMHRDMDWAATYRAIIDDLHPDALKNWSPKC